MNTLASILGEVAYCENGLIVAGRVEQTNRPEEEQLADAFRTPRPAVDLSNLGISRWTSISVSVSPPPVGIGIASMRPFLEVARIAVAHGTPAGIFNPEFRYGANQMWMWSAGVRLRAGSMHDRMGRYGVALPSMTDENQSMPMNQSMADMPGMSRGSMSHAAGKCSL